MKIQFIPIQNNFLKQNAAQRSVLSFGAVLDTFTPSNKIRQTYIIDKQTGKEVKASIIEREENNCWIYEMYTNRELVGCSACSIEDCSECDFPDNYSKGALYIQTIENEDEDRYRGVGKELQKSAVLKSKELGLGGRVFLKAAWHSHLFHYSCGFRTIEKGRDRFYLELLKKAGKERNYHYDAQHNMYLPLKNIQKLLDM